MRDVDVLAGVDTTRPNMARLYDYLLGGKDNFDADRRLGEKIKRTLPEVCLGVEEQRGVLRRVVTFLVREAGLRQLIDIGSGLPTAGNVHEVVQAIDPDVRVAYVDNDPVVLAHARALLVTDENTIAVDGDIRRPQKIIDELRHFIDFGRPVGLLLCGILHYIRDDEAPYAITRQLHAALPAGSHVFVHHLFDNGDPSVKATQAALQQGHQGRGRFRTMEEIRPFFAGLELLEPGIVPPPEWRPDQPRPAVGDHPALGVALAAVARKD